MKLISVKRTTISSARTQPSASCRGTWTGRAAWVCWSTMDRASSTVQGKEEIYEEPSQEMSRWGVHACGVCIIV